MLFNSNLFIFYIWIFQIKYLINKCVCCSCKCPRPSWSTRAPWPSWFRLWGEYGARFSHTYSMAYSVAQTRWGYVIGYPPITHGHTIKSHSHRQLVTHMSPQSLREEGKDKEIHRVSNKFSHSLLYLLYLKEHWYERVISLFYQIYFIDVLFGMHTHPIRKLYFFSPGNK